MKNIQQTTLLVLHLILVHVCLSNDGSFRASGNQLIPVYETDVSVKKEILTIKRNSADNATITVYYEFFNPKSDKELEVGFEAFSPAGDVSTRPVNGHQPYITSFTVNMNGQVIPYQVSIVSDSLYYRNGKYKTKTIASAIKESDESDYVDFFYVYHFKALFKNGINVIKHTYTVDLSSSVYETYSLNYILTAAKRWANRQIDDFTLQIDMGEFQDLCIENSFFSKLSEWQLPPNTKAMVLTNKQGMHETDTSEFFVRKGALVFQMKNFKPRGELYLHAFNAYYITDDAADRKADVDHFYSKYDRLPFSIEDQDAIREPADELSKKILKNLPFARRGYVFKSPELQLYFERQPWYQKDPSYQPAFSGLTPKEQAWLNKL